MEALLLLVLIGVLVAMGTLATRFGVDSRDWIVDDWARPVRH
jgi:hypothetical protein